MLLRYQLWYYRLDEIFVRCYFIFFVAGAARIWNVERELSD